MSVLKPKFLVLAALLAAAPLALVSACGGSAFSAAEGGGGSSSGGTSSTAGQVGTGAGTGKACDGPEDCDDRDPCTVDQCNADGTCDGAPKCLGTQKCCEGDCAECCGDADCDDGVSCTKDRCFAEQCMFVPDDTQCGLTEYCSITDNCRAKQACDTGVPGEDPTVTCADQSLCTKDECINHLCENTYCAEGVLCCEDTGCAPECCNDSQCDNDQDPCTAGACDSEGRCSLVPLCGDGLTCCPKEDGTATCGLCCSAAECEDPVGCTEDKCTVGGCTHNPVLPCPTGYVCNPVNDCERAVDCTDDRDCSAQGCGRCDDGICQYGCPMGQHCCGNSNVCAACCDASECGDNIGCTVDSCADAGCAHTPKDTLCPLGQVCNPARGGCIECTRDEECDNGSACDTDVCNQQTNKCQHTPICPQGQLCNNGTCAECVSPSDCGGIIIQPPDAFRAACYYWACEKGSCVERSEVCDLGTCCSYGCSGIGICYETE